MQVKANPNKKAILSLSSRRLSRAQEAVLSAVLSGKNVFFTGSAGKQHLVLAPVCCFLGSAGIFLTTWFGDLVEQWFPPSLVSLGPSCCHLHEDQPLWLVFM